MASKTYEMDSQLYANHGIGTRGVYCYILTPTLSFEQIDRGGRVYRNLTEPPHSELGNKSLGVIGYNSETLFHRFFEDYTDRKEIDKGKYFNTLIELIDYAYRP